MNIFYFNSLSILEKQRGIVLASKFQVDQLIKKKVMEPLLEEDFNFEKIEENFEDEYNSILVIFL